MTLYLLDTNIASHAIKGDVPAVRRHLLAVPMHQVAISAITQAELRYGVAKRGHPAGLAARVHEFLIRVQVCPWDAQAADVYGTLRAACEARGMPLAPLDTMIAAHAQSLGATLVTRDRAFGSIPEGLTVQDWTQD